MRRLAGIAACASALALPAAAASVQVEVDGVEPGGGAILVALCQGDLSEPACSRGDEADTSDGRTRVTFRDVAPGVYAVAAFQDANGNGRLDRTGLGLPLEPYGFSGESGIRASERGRPSFVRAAFALREPGAVLRVRLVRALPRR